MTGPVVNDTMRAFGYRETVIAETEHWVVQLRPQQVTLGSLVLICREQVHSFGEVSPAGFAQLSSAVSRIEAVLGQFVKYEKINYLMLMMVDNDVHFHVLPRYEGNRAYRGIEFSDAGWPGPPALSQFVAPSADDTGHLVEALRGLWTEAGQPTSS